MDFSKGFSFIGILIEKFVCVCMYGYLCLCVYCLDGVCYYKLCVFYSKKIVCGYLFFFEKWGWFLGCYGELSRGFGVEGVRRCEEVWVRRWGVLM